MDVRCEKCQTEYELDEARLKPGGVTVKCTNCGHMFKIRKRSQTNVGQAAPVETRPRTPSNKTAVKQDEIPTAPARAESNLGVGDDTVVRPAAGGEGDERQWLIRLENGEQKSCRELATLQQWIVAGVVSRESLISRTGKTWKRLGDITELQQYFTIAEEARAKRQDRTTKETGKPAGKPKDVPGTMLGIGAASAAGGTILPDDDDDITGSMESRSTGNYKARPATTPPPLPKQPPTKTPPMGSNTATPPPELADTMLSPADSAAQAVRRPPTQPPPPPAKKQPAPSVPAGNRATAAWATDGVTPEAEDHSGPAGPKGGRIRAGASQEPAFAGRVRVMPSESGAFTSGKGRAFDDDDDDLLPGRRGSRAGLWIVLALLVLGGAGGAVYMFVIKPGNEQQVATTPPPADAAVVAVVPDAAPMVTPVIDAPAAASPIDLARAELGPDSEVKLRDALKSLEGVADPGAEAVRAHLMASIAQGLLDRAALTADKADADKLKKDAKQLTLDAGTSAQRALKAAADDPGANLAMAEVLRLQAKPAKDIKRYLDAAKAKPAPEWKRDITLAEGLVLARDAKLDEAKAMITTIDQGDDKLEASGDVRARLRLAMIAYAQNKPTDAKPLVDQVLAAQPEHATARALAARIETTVAKTDPLPPEDGKPIPGTGSATKPPDTTGGGGGGGADTYDRSLARANALAESNCSKAMVEFSKALEQKPNGVEALTGMGYCHIDAKQFSSAFSKFRAALAVSSRYEPALWGVAEAYQQQGLKDRAIEAVKAYLEVYPNAAKAQKALDRLGGGGAEKPPEPAEKPPEPTPTPTPTPPEGAGSGSG